MAGMPTGIDRSRHDGGETVNRGAISAHLGARVMYCRKCGAMNPGDSTFCESCGTRFSKTGIIPPKSPSYDEEQHLREVLAGRYEVIRLLGAGGMANVYFAREEALDRYVAVKVLPRAYLSNNDFVERFRREAKISAQLEHPNIITIHTIGFDDGVIYFVMNYLPGGSLAERIRGRQGLELLEIIRWGRDISKGLAYAHEHGVIHRDLKPENVMLDEKENAVVTDFGIAYAAESNRVTRTGVAVGTAAYMSPEQAAGKTIDGRSDIYSLGVLLYQMATGTMPFSADDPAGLMYQHVHVPPEPPDIRNPHIPVWLRETILTCLAKKPADRFDSAADVLTALTDGYRRFRNAPRIDEAPVDGETLTSELRRLPADDPQEPDAPPMPEKTGASPGMVAETTIAPVMPDPSPAPAPETPTLPRDVPVPSPPLSVPGPPALAMPREAVTPDGRRRARWRKRAMIGGFAATGMMLVLALVWLFGGPSSLRDWEWAAEPRYEWAQSFGEQGFAPVMAGGRYGFIDRGGELVIETRYEDVRPFQGGFTAVRERGWWTFINTSGDILSTTQFDGARGYEDGYVPVRLGRSWGYINAAGNFAIQPQFDDVGMFRDGIAPVLRNGRWGVINKSGILIVPSRYEDAEPASEGFLAVRQDSVWGYIDTYGDLVIEPRFNWAGPFSGGRALVLMGGRWGYIDRAGEMIVEPVFEEGAAFSEGRALVFRDGVGLFIDDRGEPATTERFDDGRSFAEGFAAVCHGEAWGYLDITGALAIPYTFENARDFSEGVAAVCSGGLWGFVDTTGAFVIEPQFADAGSFADGMAAVRSGDGWGFIRFAE